MDQTEQEMQLAHYRTLLWRVIQLNNKPPPTDAMGIIAANANFDKLITDIKDALNVNSQLTKPTA